MAWLEAQFKNSTLNRVAWLDLPASAYSAAPVMANTEQVPRSPCFLGRSSQRSNTGPRSTWLAPSRTIDVASAPNPRGTITLTTNNPARRQIPNPTLYFTEVHTKHVRVDEAHLIYFGPHCVDGSPVEGYARAMMRYRVEMPRMKAGLPR